jgi:hypothetical protein
LTLTSPTGMQPYTAVLGNATSSAVAQTCPLGTTNATSGYAFTDCTDIRAGYAMQPGARSSVSEIQLCTAVGCVPPKWLSRPACVC